MISANSNMRVGIKAKESKPVSEVLSYIYIYIYMIQWTIICKSALTAKANKKKETVLLPLYYDYQSRCPNRVT